MAHFKKCTVCKNISEATDIQLNIIMIDTLKCPGCGGLTKHEVVTHVEEMAAKVMANQPATTNRPGGGYRDGLD